MRRRALACDLCLAFVLAVTLVACGGHASKQDGGDGGLDGADGSDGGDQPTSLEVISVDPDHGPPAGGTVALVSGRGFEQGAGVSFGANDAQTVNVVSSYQLRATTPPGAPGRVPVIVRNPGGGSASLANAFEYRDEATATIGWCSLQSPAAATTAPGLASEPFYGRVYSAGCTDGDMHCEAISGQVGHGPNGSDPSAAPGTWSWTDATYNPGHAGDDNDEYSAAVTEPAAGTYAVAYRFSADGGAGWTYCDLDGSDNGFDPAQAASLTVADQQVEISWCALRYPPVTTTQPDVATEPIFGRVFAAGCTDGASQCANLTGQLGWGDPAVNPSVDPAAWSWVAAGYNPAHADDDNDEHLASITEAAQGSYAYAYRFSADGGATWVYCDLDGSDNGFALDQAGSLTVSGGGQQVDWCTLQHPATTGTAPGVATEPIYGQVYLVGCTEGSGACAGISAELGIGQEGADPATFTWTPASHNPGVEGNNDEYVASLTPADAGSYDYAFRFSADGGVSWLVCDLDGSDNGYDAAQAGDLQVQARTIDWCNLQYPPNTSAAPDSDTEVIFGRVYVSGCSDGADRCHGLLAELGYGQPGVDPSSAPQDYLWFPASYNGGHADDDNDEYEGVLHPMGTGTFSYAYRFSGDGGASWSLCDLTGSADGFSTSNLGALTVSN